MDTAVHPMRQWRKDTGTTLGDLATAVGVTGSHLSEIERGLSSMSLGLAKRLSQQTGIPLEKLAAAEAAQ